MAKNDETSDRSVTKSDQNEKQRDRTPFADLLLRHSSDPDFPGSSIPDRIWSPSGNEKGSGKIGLSSENDPGFSSQRPPEPSGALLKKVPLKTVKFAIGLCLLLVLLFF